MSARPPSRLADARFSEQATVRGHKGGQAAARGVELRCTELVAERTRSIDELASTPQVARALAARARFSQEQASEAAQRATTVRAERLASALASVRGALDADDIDEAQKLLGPLAREFPEQTEVNRWVGITSWRLRQRVVAPAEAVLRDLQRRTYQDDAEAALGRLAELRTSGLPEHLARRIFAPVVGRLLPCRPAARLARGARAATLPVSVAARCGRDPSQARRTRW